MRKMSNRRFRDARGMNNWPHGFRELKPLGRSEAQGFRLKGLPVAHFLRCSTHFSWFGLFCFRTLTYKRGTAPRQSSCLVIFVGYEKREIGNLVPSGRDVIVEGIPQFLHGGPELRGILHCDHFCGEVNDLLFGGRDRGHRGRMPNRAKRTLYNLCGTLDPLLRPLQARFFFIQKVSDLCGQFDEFVGVLLGSYLLAERSPAFTIFALHKRVPRGRNTALEKYPIN